jgi:hypothetical protein
MSVEVIRGILAGTTLGAAIGFYIGYIRGCRKCGNYVTGSKEADRMEQA